MSRRKTLFILWSALLTAPVLAQENATFFRSLWTESPTVENTYYFQAAVNNDFSPWRGIYFYGGGSVALGKDWGLDFDFPTIYTLHPFGQEPAVLGPIGLFARYCFARYGEWTGPEEGVFSVEAGGSYGVASTLFPFFGSSLSAEVLGAWRWGRVYLQGNLGYNAGLDPQVEDELFVNTVVGWRMDHEWYLQADGTLSILTTGAFQGTSKYLVPQVAFQPGDWLFTLGEAFRVDSSTVYTEFQVARAF